MSASRAKFLIPGALLLTLGLTACDSGMDEAALEARLGEMQAELEDRFTPGLHTLMVDLGVRHANLWFAGEAGNWPLADYMVHELEELVEEIEELHPMYREIRVAELIGEMTHPAIEDLEDAVDAGDLAAFQRAYDDLTVACNACHIASDKAELVIQRPTAPVSTNLRFTPER
ncbi:MAG: hypothetical protein EA422_05590 [Gemmatimonadales bacterium]|nr:MAG: hypothetical protein EA422_05590 [Gemmatimonadales bacterium]